VNAHRSPRVQSAQPPSAGARVTRSDP
jgi:hypothetical protein